MAFIFSCSASRTQDPQDSGVDADDSLNPESEAENAFDSGDGSLDSSDFASDCHDSAENTIDSTEVVGPPEGLDVEYTITTRGRYRDISPLPFPGLLAAFRAYAAKRRHTP